MPRQDNSSQPCAGTPANPVAQQRWGKYRGIVVDNMDRTGQGRLWCEVPALPAMRLNWAVPCVPYAGPREGLHAIPPIGANVWIEFEGGNPSHPIWTGCYWDLAEAPVPPAKLAVDSALVKTLTSAGCTLQMDDTPEAGGITLKASAPAVPIPVTLTMSATGLEITVGASTLTMSAEAGITLKVGTSVVKVEATGVSAQGPMISLNATDKVSVAAANASVSAGTQLAVAAQTTSVTSALNITGATTAKGSVAVQGPLSGTAGLTITGSSTMTGEMKVAGDLTAALGLKVLGSTMLVGNLVGTGIATITGPLTVPTVVNALTNPPFP